MTSLIILAALLLGVSYTVTLRRRQPARLWEWLHGLVATVLSVLLGVATAFGVYNTQQRSAERREEQRFRFLVQQELSELRRLLKHGESAQLMIGATELRPLITFLQAPALEIAAQSGQFSDVDTANMFHMARKIKTYNVEVQFLIAAVNVPTPDLGRVVFAVKNMETTRKSILEDIEMESRRLGIQLVEHLPGT